MKVIFDDIREIKHYTNVLVCRGGRGRQRKLKNNVLFNFVIK